MTTAVTGRMKAFELVKGLLFLLYCQTCLLTPCLGFVLVCYVVSSVLGYTLRLFMSFLRVILNIERLQKKTVLLGGGHTVEALHIARLLKSEGFRVVAYSTRLPIFSLTFFSRSVHKFYWVRSPRQDPHEYTLSLLDIAARENATVFLPISKPKDSHFDALAKSALETRGCFCFVPSSSDIDKFINLDKFYEMVEDADLEPVSSYRVTNIGKLDGLYSKGVINGCRFMCRSIAPNGLDDNKWFTMPRSLQEAYEKYARYEISLEKPWIVAKAPQGENFYTFTAVRENRVVINITATETSHPAYCYVRDIDRWLSTFFRRNKIPVSGLFSFRFLKTPEGRLYPIQCRPTVTNPVLFAHNELLLFRRLLSPHARHGITLKYDNSVRSRLFSVYEELVLVGVALFSLNVVEAVAHVEVIVKSLFLRREVTLNVRDPLPFFVWNHVYIACNLLKGLLRGASVRDMDFITGRTATVAARPSTW